jgi:hypothetical protein
LLHGRTPTRAGWNTIALGGITVALAVGALAPLAPAGSTPASTDAGVTSVQETRIEVGAAAAATTGGSTGVAVPTGTDMVGFTWAGDPAGELELRSRNADGTWTDWVHVHGDGAEAPDPGAEGDRAAGASITPVWVGGTDRVEVQVEPGLTDVVLHALEIGSAPVDTDAPAVAAAATGSQPAIHFRAEWGAGPWAYANSDCGAGPRYARPHYFVIHHTVNPNSYAAGDVAGMLRGIQSFHQNTNGWCDIAYNFIVDRFGRIWEARMGGIDRGVIGGHAAGHNTGSVGIALLGDHQAASVPAGAVAAVADLVGWKSAVHFINPQGQTTVDGHASPTVLGHRNVVSTTCPGDLAYSRLGQIRADAASARTNYAPFYTEYARRYIDAAYWTFLGRPVDPAGEQFWVGVVTSGQPLTVFTGTLARSDEWINVSLDVLYRNVFGRPGDPAGMRFWADRVRAGMRLTDVGIAFYGSPEYFARAGGTNEQFVRALYQALLLRPADQAGIDYWTGLLRAGRSTGDVAGGFYGSIESRSGRVAGLYEAVLDRGPDPAGLGFWADQLLRVDDVDLAAYLAASEEYFWAAAEG